VNDPVRLETLYSADMIAQRLGALASEIAEALPRDFVAIAILKGSFVFAADLVRALAGKEINPEFDFMTLSSYGVGTESSGTVRLLRDAEIDVAGRTVLLIDDILDSGRTLDFARRHLLGRGASDVRICVLLEKTASQKPSIAANPDFSGFSCPAAFVAGYGMDYAHKYRGLPFVAILCQ
jgi:hypoxanthine phosphoribosyltransferase